LLVLLSDARVVEYLTRRTAVAAAWLLVAWTTAMAGHPHDGASLARHAITLDPERVAVVDAARVLTRGPSSP
jgi:hypothetical protein